MTNTRLAIALAACYALLLPALTAAATWNQIKGASVDIDAMNTPLTATNIPAGGKDNVDVYATWGDDSSVRVASCGAAVKTSCPTFTGWVNISPTTDPGTFGTASAVGWGSQRYVFMTTGGSLPGRPGPGLLSYATRNGT